MVSVRIGEPVGRVRHRTRNKRSPRLKPGIATRRNLAPPYRPRRTPGCRCPAAARNGWGGGAERLRLSRCSSLTGRGTLPAPAGSLPTVGIGLRRGGLAPFADRRGCGRQGSPAPYRRRSAARQLTGVRSLFFRDARRASAPTRLVCSLKAFADIRRWRILVGLLMTSNHYEGTPP